MESLDNKWNFMLENHWFIWIMSVYLCHTGTDGVGRMKRNNTFMLIEYDEMKMMHAWWDVFIIIPSSLDECKYIKTSLNSYLSIFQLTLIHFVASGERKLKQVILE